MTKDVLVTVRGLQMTPDGDDTIEVTTTGKYYEKDGKRYLFYDEIGDDTNLIVKNSIQITEEHVSVSKKGLINAQMNLFCHFLSICFLSIFCYCTDFSDLFVSIRDLQTITSFIFTYEVK